MENVLKEKFSDYSSVKPAVMSQSDVYLDEDGFANRKAFVDFVDFLDSSDGIRVAFVDVFLIANNKGRSFGSKALKIFYENIKQNFVIFRMAGTKFNVMLSADEEEDFCNFMESMKKQEKIWESLFQFNYVIVPQVVCSDNLAEIQRQGIDSLFAERNKKEKKKEENFSLEDLLSSIEPKKEVPVPAPPVQEQQDEVTYSKVYEMPERKERVVVADKVIDKIRIENDWRGEITLHETAPDVKDVKLYVFPFQLLDFPIHCPFIMVKDDLLEYGIQGGKSVTFNLDQMKFNIVTTVTKQGQLQTQCMKMMSENQKIKRECDVEIQNFSGSKEKLHLSFDGKYILPLKPNVYGNWDFVVLYEDKKTIKRSVNGLWEFNGIKYTVTTDEEEFYLTRTYEEEKVIKC